MASEQIDIKNIQALKETLKKFNRDLYISGWLTQAKEAENELNLEEESEAAEYYFDYVYEHGEHPR
jgi:hypothetical protein